LDCACCHQVDDRADDRGRLSVADTAHAACNLARLGAVLDQDPTGGSFLHAETQDADIRKQSPIIKWLSADKRDFAFGST
jgi:hypothetical protein